MHAWLPEILPDAPQQHRWGESRLVVESAAHGTQLVATYGDGDARFSSDSACTPSLLRGALTRCDHRTCGHSTLWLHRRDCHILNLVRRYAHGEHFAEGLPLRASLRDFEVPHM